MEMVRDPGIDLSGDGAGIGFLARDAGGQGRERRVFQVEKGVGGEEGPQGIGDGAGGRTLQVLAVDDRPA